MSEYLELTKKRMKVIGSRIRLMLKLREISVKDAASLFNMNEKHYDKLLRGQRNFTLPVLLAHCELLNVTMDDLVFDRDAEFYDGLRVERVDYTFRNILDEIRYMKMSERLRIYSKLGRDICDRIDAEREGIAE